jgi:cytochrome c oxidase cbb3-type subunit 2
MQASQRGIGPGPLAAVIVTVAATYVLLLLFAELALVEIINAAPGVASGRELALASLAIGGVAGSRLAAIWFRPGRCRVALWIGFAGCGWAAMLAQGMASTARWSVALLTGLTLGWLAVTLASGLPAALGGGRLGRAIGWGTGLAYAFCNLPPVFAAAPARQAMMAAAVAGVGLIAVCGLRCEPVEGAESAANAGRPMAVVITVFLMLIGLDSGAFYIIQHTPGWQEQTWRGDAVLGGNAAVHVVAAVWGGYWLDRGGWHGLMLLALAALVAACALLTGGVAASVLVRGLYTAGVSLYSVALVYTAATGGRRLAGWLFAVAGWMGSVLGIRLAQDFHRVPFWFLGLAVLVVGTALASGGLKRWATR